MGYNRESLSYDRAMALIPVTVPHGRAVRITAGGQEVPEGPQGDAFGAPVVDRLQVLTDVLIVPSQVSGGDRDLTAAGNPMVIAITVPVCPDALISARRVMQHVAGPRIPQSACRCSIGPWECMATARAPHHAITKKVAFMVFVVIHGHNRATPLAQETP